MLLTSLITAAEETSHSGVTISPLGVGAIALGVLLFLLVGLLMFGRGREHS